MSMYYLIVLVRFMSLLTSPSVSLVGPTEEILEKKVAAPV
jgi:hypothetical protein